MGGVARIAVLLALLALAPALAQPAPAPPAERIAAYLRSVQDPDGSFRMGGGFLGGAGDTGAFLTPLAIQALSAAGLDPREVRAGAGRPSAVEWLRDHRLLYNPTEANEWSKQVLAIAAAYGDPRAFGGFDYAAALRGRASEGQMGSEALVNDDLFAILALRAAGVPAEDPLVRAMRDEVLEAQNADGSWNYARGRPGDVDNTAAGVAALAAAGVGPDEAPLARAVAWLRGAQLPSGAFPFGSAASLQSTAWAVWGLRSAGEDPAGPSWAAAAGATPVSWLASRVRADGRVVDASGNERGPWEAADVLVALAADRYPVAAWLPAWPAADPARPLAGLPVLFTDPGPATQRSWEPGDGTLLEGPSPLHRYARAGSYRVALTARDGAYGKHIAYLGIIVDPSPPVAVLEPWRAQAYRGQPVALSGLSSWDPDGRVAAYAWDFGDGATQAWSGMGSAQHAYRALGLHRVVLSVRDDEGREAAASGLVEVVNAPPLLEPLPNRTADRVGPLAVAAVARDPDGGPLRFAWDFGDGARAEGQRAAHRYTSLGRFQASLTVEDADGAIAHAPFEVEVVNLPPRLATLRVEPAMPAPGEEAALRGLAWDPEGGPLRARWAIDGAGLPDEGLEVRRSFAAGRHLVRLTILDADGAEASLEVPVEVRAPAEAPVAAAPAPPGPPPPVAPAPAPADEEAVVATAMKEPEEPAPGPARLVAEPAGVDPSRATPGIPGGAALAALVLAARAGARRGKARGAVPALLALALGAGLVALAGLPSAPEPLQGGPIEAPVAVVGRTEEFFNATLALPARATALDALDAAARAGNFTYHTTTYPGMGVYVVEVRGERAEPGGAEGWVYHVRRDGTWQFPDRSAAAYSLRSGDAVRWSWSAAP